MNGYCSAFDQPHSVWQCVSIYLISKKKWVQNYDLLGRDYIYIYIYVCVCAVCCESAVWLNSVWMYICVLYMAKFKKKLCYMHVMTWARSNQHYVLQQQGPLYQYGFILNPAWMNNMSSKVWDEITHPLPNFNSATVEVWEWMSYFSSYFLVDVIIFSCWDQH